MKGGSSGIPIGVQRTVIELLTGDTADLKGLARIAERDPATFFKGANLRSCNLTTADLDGIDLTGAEIADSKLPPSVVRRYWKSVGAKPLEAGEQIKETIEQLAPNIAPDHLLHLRFALLRDLVRREDRASIELLAKELLHLAKEASPSEIPEIRSIWAKGIFDPTRLTVGNKSNFERKWPLLQPEVIDFLHLEAPLEDVILSLIRELDALPDSISFPGKKLLAFSLKQAALKTAAREILISSFVRSAGATNSFEVILEIARGLSRLSQPNIQIWRRSIQEAPTLADANAVIREMIREGVTPKVDEWNSLIRKASTVSDRRRILYRMSEADVFPNSTTCLLLLEVASSFSAGVKLVEVLADSGASFFDVSPLVRLIKSTKDASEFFRLIDEYDVSESYSVSRILGQLALVCSAKQLLRWAFTDLPSYGVRPIPEDLGSSIDAYIRSKRIQDALSITLLFPEIAESAKIFRNDSYRSIAFDYFRKELKGTRPHVSATALAFFHHALGNRAEAQRWARFAMKYRKELGLRYEPLEALSNQLSGEG